MTIVPSPMRYLWLPEKGVHTSQEPPWDPSFPCAETGRPSRNADAGGAAPFMLP